VVKKLRAAQVEIALAGAFGGGAQTVAGFELGLKKLVFS